KTASVKFAISSPVSSVALSADRTAPQPAGTTINWTATPTGGTPPYEYRRFTYDGTSWTAATNWGGVNTFAWTPAQANANATVSVWVRSAGNSDNAPESSAAVTFPIASGSSTVTDVALSADKSSPQSIGTTITWTAT